MRNVWLSILVMFLLGATLCSAAGPAHPTYTGMARIDAIAQGAGASLTPGPASEGAAFGNAHWLKGAAKAARRLV